jgi:hypothetical protein
MPEKRMMLLTADKLMLATRRGDVVVILDLTSAGVFPEMEVGLRMLPAEARMFAGQLKEWADKAENELPRA